MGYFEDILHDIGKAVVDGAIEEIKKSRRESVERSFNEENDLKRENACKWIVKKISLSHKNCNIDELMDEIDELLYDEIDDCMDKYIEKNYPNSIGIFTCMHSINSGLSDSEIKKIMLEYNDIVNDKVINKIDSYIMNKYGVSVRRELEQAYPRRS